MDFQSLLHSARSSAGSAWQNASEILESAAGSFGSGLGYVSQSLQFSRLFGSTEISDSQYDEKHYFLIPNKLAERGYSLYSMRCLPEGVPPINDLPKQRVFHLPNEHAGQLVEQLLKDEAASQVLDSGTESPTANRLADLADRIDELDNKAFNGALLIGGLVALANPVAGGILAAKAMIPSVGLLLARYGLKQAGDSLDERNLKKQLLAAEKKVLSEFHGKSTSLVVERLLEQLDRSINSSEMQYDPLVDEPLKTVESSDRLTAKAIANTYEKPLADSSQWDAAGLGQEDIRWLQVVRTIAESDEG